MKSRTSESIKSISNAIVKKDQAALKSQVDSYKAFIDVKHEKCRYDWPKAFDCGSSEECKIRTVYRSDCILYFLTNAVSRFLTVKGSKDWSHTEVVKSKALLNIYLFYQPYLRESTMTQSDIDTTITTLHQEIDKLRNKFNIPGFEEVVKIVPQTPFLPTWMKRNACFQQTIPKLYKPYCVVSSLVDAIQQFTISIQNSLNKKIRNLNPSIDYKTLLEQLTLSRISAFLGKQAQTYFQILSNKIDEIPDFLQQNFGAIGTYFQKLAIYDSKKSAADISFIIGSLNKFRNALNPKLEKVSEKFGLLLKLAIGASTADLAQKGVELGLEIAINCNPIKHLFGSSDPVSIMDRVSALAKSAVTLTKLITMGVRVIKELGRRAVILKSGFGANAAFIDVVKTLIEKLNSKDEDLEEKIQLFLTNYNDYSPTVIRSQITGFGAYWEAAIDELCEAAFEGDSAAAAAIQIGIAGKGDCLSIRPLIAEVITLNEEIYDYQFEMMETLATACRAKYASKLAKNMQIVYTSKVKVDMNFFRNNAIISYLISTLHIWGMVTEYCDIFTYTGSGILPTACTTAKELPDSTNVGQVLSHKQAASCNAGSRATVILKIPTATTDKGRAYINTNRLFKGEVLSFQIPDSNWLLSKKIISSSELNNEAFYVEQFQMFIPANPDGASTVQILVSPSLVNVLKVGVNSLKYVYLSSGYLSRYTVNQAVCFGTKTWLPYDYCQSMSKICIVKDGKQVRDIQPSIFNRWNIRMTDPTGLTPPNPKTNIELMAKLTYCTRSSAAMRKRRTLAFENLRHGKNKRQASSKFCCTANKYWAGTSCQECPAGSKRQLSGYYCQ